MAPSNAIWRISWRVGSRCRTVLAIWLGRRSSDTCLCAGHMGHRMIRYQDINNKRKGHLACWRPTTTARDTVQFSIFPGWHFCGPLSAPVGFPAWPRPLATIDGFGRAIAPDSPLSASEDKGVCRAPRWPRRPSHSRAGVNPHHFIEQCQDSGVASHIIHMDNRLGASEIIDGAVSLLVGRAGVIRHVVGGCH